MYRVAICQRLFPEACETETFIGVCWRKLAFQNQEAFGLLLFYFIFLREKAELIYSSMQEPSITRVVLRIWALSTYTSHLVGEMEEEEKDIQEEQAGFFRKDKWVLGKQTGH